MERSSDLSPIGQPGLKHILYTIEGVHQICQRIYREKDVKIYGTFGIATYYWLF